MNTLIHTGLLMLLLSSSPALCQEAPPSFPVFLYKPELTAHSAISLELQQKWLEF